MNCPHGETMADLAASGRLQGRLVRILEDVGSFVAKGSIGLVLSVRSGERRATARYRNRPEVPWAYQEVESPFSLLELVGGDDEPL